MTEFLLKNGWAIWIGIAPGLLFGKNLNTWEWWVMVLTTIFLVALKP